MIAPDKIYLQVDPEGESADDSVEGVTWCQDKINDNDVEYIRTDLINASQSDSAGDALSVVATNLKKTVGELQEAVNKFERP